MKEFFEQQIIDNQFIIRIYPDDSHESPREWDNDSTMVCFHSHYDLGDKNHGYDLDDYNSWDELKKAIIKNNPGCIILPLYLYDDSGITMNTTGFSRRWDSGQVGFIYITRQDILHSYGNGYLDESELKRLNIKKYKNVTPQLRKQALDGLIRDVKTYDQYLTGDVYRFNIYSFPSPSLLEEMDIDPEAFTEWEIEQIEDFYLNMIDSCGGYYGLQDTIKEAIDSLPPLQKKSRIKGNRDVKLFGNYKPI